MKFENTLVSNFKCSFYGMRNPLNSWKKSDSIFDIGDTTDLCDAESEVIPCWIIKKEPDIEYYSDEYEEKYQNYCNWLESNGILRKRADIYDYAFIGPNDMTLAQRLITSGPEHCKFLRQIQVSVDITAPLYWWKEFDTYKVGTAANSTSTMHTLCKSPIAIDKFEFDNLDLIVDNGKSIDGEWERTQEEYIEDIIDMCEQLRQKYLKTEDKRYWRALVQILPEAFLQTRTVTMSYANLRNMYFQRRAHKLTEWREDFINWIESLPYAEELIMLEEK